MEADQKESKKDSESEYIIIERDNEVPLKFQGELIGEADGNTTSGPTQNRWDNYYLYRTEAGKYVLHHEYHTCWQGERGSSEAWVRDTIQEIIHVASYYDDGVDKLSDVLLNCINDAGLDDEIAEVVE